MSYLDLPRLHFFGTFIAQPSTINNTPANYDVSAPLGDPLWNPNGTHFFGFTACKVTGVVLPDGSTTDPVVGGAVSTPAAGQPAAAVLVDLDTEQQLVSQVFGLQVTVALPKGGAITGTMETVNFFDITFARVHGSGGKDGGASAVYQSVLRNVQWKGAAASKFAQALQGASPNALSIHFVVDLFSGSTKSGRVTGTIGPYFESEPATFTNARLLRPTGSSQWGSINFAPAKSDPRRGTITFDFGNAFPIDSGGSVSSFPAPLQAVILPAGGAPVVLGEIDTSDAAYRNTGFVQEFKADPHLLQDAPTGVAVQTVAAHGSPARLVTILSENPSGAYVNVAPYVLRLSPGDVAVATLWANVFEKPAANVTINLGPYNDILNQQAPDDLPIATPPTAIAFPPSVTTDANGRAQFAIAAADPGTPRDFIDGQVYGIGFQWTEDTSPDPFAFFSVKVFSGYQAPDTPTWVHDVRPVLAQYAHLYPAMQAIIKLDDFNAVVKNIQPIIARLSLPFDDPRLMPLTRELSPAKRDMILHWARIGHPQS
ncbi:MAG TPA: hypothetical protein VGR02_17945 [Thermoanaerobaculia bacterium]|jgi:hypothetical protein|nr:hypothetical protein [Thermoanaerobaculia bacterium]